MKPLLLLLASCTPGTDALVCDTGMHEQKGHCVTDDADADADADTDTDTDAGPSPMSGVVVAADVSRECRSAFFNLDLENQTSGKSDNTRLEPSLTEAPLLSAVFEVGDGDRIDYALSYTACDSDGDEGGSLGVIGAGELYFLFLHAAGSGEPGGLRTEGTDYSTTEVRVAFRGGTSVTDAEALRVAYPVEVLSQEADEPPTFVVRDAAGTHALLLAMALLAEREIGYAAPEGL